MTHSIADRIQARERARLAAVNYLSKSAPYPSHVNVVAPALAHEGDKIKKVAYKIGQKCVHIAPVCGTLDGKFVWTVDRRDVTLMAVAKGFAMIRRPSCMPYAASLKEMEF